MTRPPEMAAWMLKHLVAGKPNEPLAGDLLEELRLGRSSAWYWRQVVCAVLASYRRVIAGHRTALVFAAVWSLLSPAWELLLRAGNYHVIFRVVDGFGWPWAAVCGVVLAILLRLAFVWTGLLLYIAVDTRSGEAPRAERIFKGFVRSSLVLMPLWAPAHLYGDFFSSGVPQSHSVAMVITSFGTGAVLERLAFFATTLFAIWTSGPHSIVSSRRGRRAREAVS